MNSEPGTPDSPDMSVENLRENAKARVKSARILQKKTRSLLCGRNCRPPLNTIWSFPYIRRQITTTSKNPIAAALHPHAVFPKKGTSRPKAMPGKNTNSLPANTHKLRKTDNPVFTTQTPKTPKNPHHATATNNAHVSNFYFFVSDSIQVVITYSQSRRITAFGTDRGFGSLRVRLSQDLRLCVECS